ncbi:hypothetical protein LTS17_010603 [Exophiala oligosperma]
MVAASTTSTPTVSVIINQVFALGLPCADDEGEDEDKDETHLSTGSKIGIGVGVGVAGILLSLSVWACLAVRHRRRKRMRALEVAATQAGGPIRPSHLDTTTGPTPNNQGKHVSTATTISPQTIPASPQQMSHVGGYLQQGHGYGPAFGYQQPQYPQYPQYPLYQQHDPYGGPPNSGFYQPSQSQSPPPMYGGGYYTPNNNNNNNKDVVGPQYSPALPLPVEVDGGGGGGGFDADPNGHHRASISTGIGSNGPTHPTSDHNTSDSVTAVNDTTTTNTNTNSVRRGGGGGEGGGGGQQENLAELGGDGSTISPRHNVVRHYHT